MTRFLKMKIEHTSKMIIEIERVRIVCRRTMQIINFCSECFAETDFVTIVEAARIVQNAEEAVSRLIEAGILHALSATNGATYICLASLEAFEENRFR